MIRLIARHFALRCHRLAVGGDCAELFMSEPDRLYYLRNFTTALAWLRERYADLLAEDEAQFIRTFGALPARSQALLVRLIMRKIECFRAAKVVYHEIGDIPAAAKPLVEHGLLDAQPPLTIEALFKILRRDELIALFATDARRGLKKVELLASLQSQHLLPRTFESWTASDECAYRVLVADICTRLRLLFFGSFHQDWSEFVLADLGIFKYEYIDFDNDSRAFDSREDIEAFFRIHACRARLHAAAPLNAVLDDLPADELRIDWLEARRAKLLFNVARQWERAGDAERALAIYRSSTFPGARLRSIRVLERAGMHEEALHAAATAYERPESSAELHALERTIPRLQRLSGLMPPKRVTPRHVDTIVLRLPWIENTRVEERVRALLHRPEAPTLYVENALFTALFGLLFWDAIFAPVRGAFFHRFHVAPMDLHSADFYERRRDLFEQRFALLASGEYRAAIRRTFAEKNGIACAFIVWGRIDAALLELALRCISPRHLESIFRRLLLDLREHCSGLPDLIQFRPDESWYRLIEVKGPGDRLQENQKHWIQHCAAHDIPVCVAHVEWAEATA